MFATPPPAACACAGSLPVGGDALLHHRAEMPDQSLDRPGRGVAQRADRVAFDLARDLLQGVDLRPARRGLRPCGSSRASSSRCLPGTACTGRSSRACRIAMSRAIARMMSVDLSMTMTAAVPRPLLHVAQAVEIHQHGVADRLRNDRDRCAAGNHRQQIVPPAAHAAGMLVDQFPQAGCRAPPRRCRACSRGPEMQNTLGPVFFWRPMPANQAAPRRRMVGATAMLSTLFTVVGQPYSPTAAGNGGFSRGMPFLPSRLSSRAVSSPQI